MQNSRGHPLPLSMAVRELWSSWKGGGSGDLEGEGLG
jgi:hypothetical protein